MSMTTEVNNYNEQRQERPWLLPEIEITTPFQPPKWLIKGWLPENSQAMLYGESGTGKSFVAIDMALSIACNEITDWHGLKIKHGGVLYLSGENFYRISVRLVGWKQAHGVKRDSLDNIRIISRPITITEKSNKDIASAIEADGMKNLKLIVIDSLIMHFTGDPDSYSDAVQFLNNIAELQRRFNCAVLIVDPYDGDAFFALADIALQTKLNKSTLTLSQVKNRDGVPQQSLHFELTRVEIDGAFNENGASVTTLALTRCASCSSETGKCNF